MRTPPAALSALRAGIARRRRPLLAAAAALFLAGLAVSAARLELRAADLAPLPALAILLVFAPLTLGAAALSLQLAGRTAGRRLGFRAALAWSAGAQIAELAPLPGGAVMRGAALVRAGASPGRSGAVVALTAALTLALSLVAASLPLLLSGHAAGVWLLAGAGAGALAATGAILHQAGAGVAAASLAVRALGLGLAALRLWLAFRAIGAPLPLVDSALFAAAATLGAASGLAPGGLGISEALGAAAAPLVAAAPAAAFLALALNRLLGLAACGAALALLGGTPREEGT